MPYIVFVCTGNICRSPMAEGLLRHYWKKAGGTNLVASSMGIHGLDAEPASILAQEACRENGIDISAHRSQPLDYDELARADLILTMDRPQMEYIQACMPPCRHKTFLLGAWPGKGTGRSAVADPMGGSLEVYRRTFQTIREHIERILPALSEYFG